MSIIRRVCQEPALPQVANSGVGNRSAFDRKVRFPFGICDFCLTLIPLLPGGKVRIILPLEASFLLGPA